MTRQRIRRENMMCKKVVLSLVLVVFLFQSFEMPAIASINNDKIAPPSYFAKAKQENDVQNFL